MAELLQIEEKKPAEAAPATPTATKQIYPIVEEMTFRGIIQSEEQGMALLRAVQILVNELGATSIIQVMSAIEKKPQLLQQAKTYLPYITML